MKSLSKPHTEAIEKAKTEQAKVKAAALAMIETPMDLIKAVLLKHEEAVIEVMLELHKQQQADEALLRQALEAMVSWFPSADTYRRLGFDPKTPMQVLKEAKAILAKEDK